MKALFILVTLCGFSFGFTQDLQLHFNPEMNFEMYMPDDWEADMYANEYDWLTNREYVLNIVIVSDDHEYTVPHEEALSNYGVVLNNDWFEEEIITGDACEFTWSIGSFKPYGNEDARSIGIWKYEGTIDKKHFAVYAWANDNTDLLTVDFYDNKLMAMVKSMRPLRKVSYKTVKTLLKAEKYLPDDYTVIIDGYDEMWWDYSPSSVYAEILDDEGEWYGSLKMITYDFTDLFENLWSEQLYNFNMSVYNTEYYDVRLMVPHHNAGDDFEAVSAGFEEFFEKYGGKFTLD